MTHPDGLDETGMPGPTACGPAPVPRLV